MESIPPSALLVDDDDNDDDDDNNNNNNNNKQECLGEVVDARDVFFKEKLVSILLRS